MRSKNEITYLVGWQEPRLFLRDGKQWDVDTLDKGYHPFCHKDDGHLGVEE
jgi:hypothetical protein